MRLSAALPKSVERFVRGRIAQLPEIVQYCPYLPNSQTYAILKDDSDIDGWCEDGLPIPPANLRLQYNDTKEQWIQGGKLSIAQMLSDLHLTGYEIEDGHRVLDFGCASGRMTRHLKSLSEQCEIWGVDQNAGCLFWAKRHLGQHFRFIVTTRNAHLPFEDQYFDLIYAGSVFTHIDDLTDMWLLELRRVLKPGGKVYITIHDNESIETLLKMKDQEGLPEALKKYLGKTDVRKSGFRMFTIGRSPRAQVFWDRSSFKEETERFFDVQSFNEVAHGYQTGVVMQRL